ncbi:MAG: phage major capsid domain-containing protein, partial [Candidatus Fonsibacter sp.]
MSATINNHTVSFNVQETLPLLLRMVDPEEFSKYDSMTPTALGYLADYNDAIQRLEWQIDVPAASIDTQRHPTIYRTHDVDSEPESDANSGTRPMAYHSFPTNVLAYDMNRPAGTAYYHKPRGSWRIKEIYSINGTSNKIVPGILDREVYVKIEVTEPLLLSPFIFGSGYGKQGFYG